MLPRTLSLAEINSYLLRMRYNDTKQIAESKNKNLSQFCKTMTLGYGSTHSASASPKGLFNDPYHREAIETIGPVLFDVMLSCIHKEIEEKKSDLINGKSKTIDFLPVANYDTFKKILGKSYDDFFTDESYSINIAGKDIPLVKIKIPKDAENNGLMREIAIKIARNKIGSSGQFPNKYLQQWIVANLDDNSFNNTFKELLRGVEKRHDVKEPQIEYTPSTLSINDITKNITHVVETYKGNTEQLSKMKLFSALLSDINLKNSDPEIEKQIQLSLSRLEFLLKNASDCTYNKENEKVNNTSDLFSDGISINESNKADLENEKDNAIFYKFKVFDKIPSTESSSTDEGLDKAVPSTESSNTDEILDKTVPSTEFPSTEAINNFYREIDNNKFSLFIECAFDEIIFLNALTQQKSEPEIREIITNFIKNQYLLSNADQKNISVGLTNSGIDTIAQNILAAISEKKNSQKEVSIYFNRDVYFEINALFRTLAGEKVSLDTMKECPELCLTLNNDQAQLKPHNTFTDKDKIYDILACDLLSSVSLELDYQSVNFVEYQIENQMRLRREALKKEFPENKYETFDIDNDKNLQKKLKKLIVVIDTTQNTFDDNHMAILLEKFRAEIENGTLAIITSHSLNKYFHMGFDKTPGGLTAGFYDKESFPKLKDFHENNLISNYDITDPIPQMVSTMLKNQQCINTLLEHHQSVRKNSRHLYNMVFKMLREKLTENTNPPNNSVVTPWTINDISKGHSFISIYQPTSSPFDMWGFLVLKVASEHSLHPKSEKTVFLL